MTRSPTTENQYRIATQAAGLLTRSDRSLLAVTGKDRAAWLHNLVSNAVKTLQPGEGNYAFAADVKGRTVFDLNVLVLADQLWLDIDRRWIDAAKKHLDRFIITEDVQVADRCREFDRLALLGPAAPDVVARMGFGNLAPMAQLQHVEFTWSEQSGRLIRHDFAGLPGAEILVPPPASADLVAALLDAGRPSGLARIDPDTVEILRIEAGIPASVTDIDAETIPPETGQIERGISYHKGCYLGQEIIERMRAHGILARRLVGVRIEGETAPPLPAMLRANDADVGRLTSVCWSYALGALFGLGYLKTSLAQIGQAVQVVSAEDSLPGQVAAWPLQRH